MAKVCKHQLKLINSKPKSLGANHSFQLCKKLYEVYFAERWVTFHTHEMTADNDCFTNFKYTYEFVTNFDFDELLFPRKHSSFDSLSLLNVTCDALTPASASTISHANSLYDYASRLFQAYKDPVRPIGALHFQHVLLVDKISHRFVKNLLEFLDSNSSSSRWIEFPYDNKSVNLHVNKQDISLYTMSKSLSLISCLNRTFGEEERLRKWNRVFGIWISVRHGKSIYHTDFTEFVNQHYAESFSRNAKWVSVSLDHGFSSHFRNPVDSQFFLGQNYSFRDHFRIDLEYYSFLANHSIKYYSSFVKDFF